MNIKDTNTRLVTKEERQRIQIEMLQEIDTFCRSNHLKYSLSNGTLLGAVRHGGYIPWDDDVDIVMALPDINKFKESFHSDNLQYIDVDVDKFHLYPFPRIIHKNTCSLTGKNKQSYGISIDLYPVLGLPKTKEGIDQFFRTANRFLTVRKFLLKLNSRIINSIPIKKIPTFGWMVKHYRNYLFSYPYEGTFYFFHYGGFLRWSKVMEKDLFDQMIDITFEDKTFMAFKDYDYYLKHVYGEYMVLPPVEERHPYHGGTYYWK